MTLSLVLKLIPYQLYFLHDVSIRLANLKSSFNFIAGKQMLFMLTLLRNILQGILISWFYLVMFVMIHCPIIFLFHQQILQTERSLKLTLTKHCIYPKEKCEVAYSRNTCTEGNNSLGKMYFIRLNKISYGDYVNVITIQP